MGGRAARSVALSLSLCVGVFVSESPVCFDKEGTGIYVITIYVFVLCNFQSFALKQPWLNITQARICYLLFKNI